MIPAPLRSDVENTTGTNRLRTVFISDTHLGHECCRPEQLLRYLSAINPEQLYLVGDFIDGWALQKRWRWTPAVSRIFNRLSEMACQGCSINYVVGNHDEFLRTHPLIGEILMRASITIADEFEHVTLSGRRLLVVHGDRFDDYEKCSAFFEWITTRSYNALLRGNTWCHWWFGGRRNVISASAKQLIGSVARHVKGFRTLVLEHARGRGYDGVICGHVHVPERFSEDGIEYINTGDWLENYSAVVEDQSGEMHLLYPHKIASNVLDLSELPGVRSRTESLATA